MAVVSGLDGEVDRLVCRHAQSVARGGWFDFLAVPCDRHVQAFAAGADREGLAPLKFLVDYALPP